MRNKAIKWIRVFIYSAGGILLAAAAIRFVIAAESSQVLALPEPMLGIPLRYAVLIVGGLELTAALICLFGKQVGFQLGLLAWLTTNLIVYRMGLLWMHYQPQGTCVGSLTDPLRIMRGTAGFIMEFIPAYLLFGSYLVLIWLWGSKAGRAARIVATDRHGSAAELLKMSCPSCGVHIRFACQNLGQKIPCPKCQKTITLRKPDNLKMSCFFCKEHIEFPAHAIGEKLKCPHCKMDITLKEPT
jgi:hypothetical protein